MVEQICGGKFLESENIPIRVGSQQIIIDPENFSPVEKSVFDIDCGSAGSIALMAQIALPVAIFRPGETKINLIGGTDCDFAPPIDVQIKIFAELIKKFGVNLNMKIDQRGFFPVGKGQVEYSFDGISRLKPIVIEPASTAIANVKCWFSDREKMSQIRSEMDKAKKFVENFSHEKIKIKSCEVVKTPEKSIGSAAGVYIFAETEQNFGMSSTELAKFDRKKNLKSDGNDLAQSALKRLVEDLGSDG